MKIKLQTALQLDEKDILASFRNEFVNDNNVIYLDGNSLGKLPTATKKHLTKVIENQWGKRLIRSWNENWIDLPKKVAAKIAKVVGAQPDEIFVGDSTSLNLYKLVFAVLNAKPNQPKILTDSLNFPTDFYVLQGLIEHQFKNHQLQMVECEDEINSSTQKIQQALDKNVGLLTLSHVAYKSAFMYDMKAINKLASENETLVIWDLSHAVGAVEINLNKTNADMAIGCTYKYLNGGPGAPAFLYVRKDLQEKLSNPITAWFSHAAPFKFVENYQESKTIEKFATATPHILSLAGVNASVDITLQAGMENIRKKSEQQSQFLWQLIEEKLLPLGFSFASPKEIKSRGSHISIQHPEAYRINRALIEPTKGIKIIIPDFRPPNNIRLGIAPLYNSFQDLFETVERIVSIIKTKEYLSFDKEPIGVT